MPGVRVALTRCTTTATMALMMRMQETVAQGANNVLLHQLVSCSTGHDAPLDRANFPPTVLGLLMDADCNLM